MAADVRVAAPTGRTLGARGAVAPGRSRWGTHVGLILATIVVGFLVFYAIIVATQTNTEHFAI